jgi:peptide/nickel transport system ATP-binding protein
MLSIRVSENGFRTRLCKSCGWGVRMTDKPSLLWVENLKTWLADGDRVVRAVDGVSFDIARHQTFALLGESGCGKSMTALSLLRLLPESGRIVTGAVHLDGLDLLALPEAAMRNVRGKRAAMIFQEPMTSLNPVMTVGDQIGEVLLRHATLHGAAINQRVCALLDAVGIPDAERRVTEYPFQLSGGMKQRVMIAMALAGEPELLIADEPTTALDVTIQAQVLDLLRELQAKNGMAILLITHDLGVVSEMAHRVAVMYAGEIVEIADRAQFFGSPAHPYSRKLFDSLPGRSKRGQELTVIRGAVPSLDQELHGCRFAERCDHVFELCREQSPDWSELAPGHTVRCHRVTESLQATANAMQQTAENVAEAPVAEELLQVNNLKIHFPVHKGLFKRVAGHVKAVDGVSLVIPRSRTLALVGESGCGKTTVGKGILQLLRPTEGSVRFAGAELTTLDTGALRAKRAELQIIFQDPYASLDPRMVVSDIIEEGMLALGMGRSMRERASAVDAILSQVGLSPDIKQRYPHEFSGGQRQRIAIARALAVQPQLIVCDEPTSALDVSVQAQILNLLKQLQQNLGLSYLFITHNLAVVEYLAHQVAVMYLGRIVEQGSVQEVLNQPRHPYTQALLSAVPVIEGDTRREIIRLQGDMPSPLNPPSGCHFHPRCPQAMAVCREAYPGESRVSSSQVVRCHLYP